MNAELFIREFSYLGVFLLTFISGEAALLIGGILAKRADLDLVRVIAAGFFSGLISDIVYFYIARKGGKPVLVKYKLEKKVRRISSYVDRHRILLLLTFRFMYGFRTATNALFGISNTSGRTYIFYTILGGLIWASTMAVLGYYFGNAVLGVIEKNWIPLLVLAAGLFLYYLISKIRKRIRQQKYIH